MSLVPLLHRVRRRLALHRTLAQAARETVVVAPPEAAVRSAAVFLPGQLDRVTAVQHQTTRQREMDRISATPVLHSATTAYRLEDCLLIGGSLYAGGACHQMLLDRPPLAARIDGAIDEAALVGTPVSDVYFGHHLVDDAATALLARDFARLHRPFSRHHAGWHHCAGYHRMLGLDLAVTGNARLRTAWVFDDIGMNADRRRRFALLRERLRSRSPGRGGHGVFLLRGASGQQPRSLHNERALADLLASRGFEVVDPATTGAEEIVATLSGARIAVGVEGSALAHAFLTLADGGAMLAIQPPFRFNNVWKDFTDLMAMRYGFVVGQAEGAGFLADPDELLRTIDLLT